ncbi:uncharacterized protein LOC128139577 isoform X2 [Harpia harpyja]|uniref:uncharacterized protein LOC128139577 isoform X2 n=1 Tax=Harpia harpyja TaxID=202280 RepID=UPI0022B0F4C6|nr:uncharacterized protein LOC128139577 isoform X2 [Harpia harpyja]
MPLTAAASGLRGLSLPGLPLLAARERRGTGGALTGCGQELQKLERPQKGGGWPSDWSSRRGREERRRKKRLNWERLLAVPRARAVVDVSCHHFTVVALSSAVKVQDRWKDSVVVCKYKEYSTTLLR